ncbi:MAG TPA: hypothetical protein VKY89_15490 [Thermoanaerobaculia bacterium]|nr:hypothetical protein [Thermoanaerobaculia bacterium]
MEYLTLKIASETRGLIYEKDLRVADVFGGFVRGEVSKMVGHGLLREGQRYWATVDPGYGPPPETGRQLISEETLDGGVPSSAGRSWLSMRLGDAARPEEPMSHFRLELHTMPPAAHRYRKSFLVSELDGPLRRVRTTLLDMELIASGEGVREELYARRGAAPRFEHEIIHNLPQELNDLEIRLESLPVDDAFPEKPMPDCLTCGRSGDEPPGELVVFFSQRCLELLSEHLKRRGSRSVEMGGILIGEVYRQPRVPRPFVEIEAFLPAEEAQANSISLRFTHETWQRLQARKRTDFPEEKRIVGWYHTHPPIPMQLAGKEVSTVGFFSEDDLAVQRQIFPHSWQIALVMDAESDEKVVFRWQAGGMVESDYHTFEQGA